MDATPQQIEMFFPLSTPYGKVAPMCIFEHNGGRFQRVMLQDGSRKDIFISHSEGVPIKF